VAKATDDVVTNKSLKVVTLSFFGKTGNKWSVFYSPDMMISVTLTGQLALLMLIETLELSGFTVVSANTDGIVTVVDTSRTEEFEAIMSAWEITSSLFTEETEYVVLASANVNNYLALTKDGKFKQKGLMAFVGSSGSELEKNPANYVCIDAIKAYVALQKPIEESIRECKDPTRFLTIRQVKGGGVYDGHYLGKAVRWYYAKGETRHIAYSTNGNMVARSEGARPLMELPDEIPHDLDYDWYIREAQSILSDIGL